MIHKEGYLTHRETEDIYYQSWLPSENPKAIIVLVHGLGSHSGWFSNVAEKLVESDYGVYALDLYGHGKSLGQQGHINSWDDFRGNLDYFCQWVKSQYSEQSLFILGHSLGGLIVLEYILRLSPAVNGIIIMAPALGKVGISRFKIMAGKLLSWVYPRFSLDIGIADEASSHYESIILAYNNDPLRHSIATARFSQEYFKIAQWVEDNCSNLSIPILVLQGDEDIVTPAETTRDLFAKLPEIDKQYKEYKEGYHDLHHDLCEEILIKDIKKWLDQQYQSSLPVK